MFRSLTIVAALLLSACTRQNVDLEGRTCGDACLASYVCNPLTTTCSPAIDVGCGRAGATCPDSTNTGDACDAIGAYLPCHGTALDTCENGGCRTCSTSYTWTDCACVSGTSCICSPTNGGIEICDGLDNNCDGTVDNGVDGAQGCVHAWIDADGDGYGAQGTTPICRCSVPQGYANNDDDGNDQNGEINPANGEKCNGIDDNGDGVIPDNEKDTDHDGYVPCTPWSGAVTLKGGDCIDHDNQTHPGATELCDDIDNNCDGAISDDEQDKDGDKWVGCAGWANRDGNHPDIHGGGDCDQSNGQIYPGADEFFDSHDDDCDGYVDECIIDCNCGADLFACYTLDDSSLADGSANHNTASVTSGGVSIVVAKVNNGVDFASTQKITAPKSNAQEHTEFTLSAWVNVAAWPTARGYVTDVRSEYTMRFASDGTFTCAFADTNDNIWESTTTAGLVSLGVYNHVACTYDGETLITYVNGLARASQATGGAVVRDSQNFPLAIGDGNATSGPFIGVIDHLQGFGTAHTAHQICVAAEYAGCP